MYCTVVVLRIVCTTMTSRLPVSRNGNGQLYPMFQRREQASASLTTTTKQSSTSIASSRSQLESRPSISSHNTNDQNNNGNAYSNDRIQCSNDIDDDDYDSQDDVPLMFFAANSYRWKSNVDSKKRSRQEDAAACRLRNNDKPTLKRAKENTTPTTGTLTATENTSTGTQQQNFNESTPTEDARASRIVLSQADGDDVRCSNSAKIASRIYSDSSMDYIPPSPNRQKHHHQRQHSTGNLYSSAYSVTTNFLSRLIQRTARGTRLAVSSDLKLPSSSSNDKSSQEFFPCLGTWSKKWSIPPWIALSHDRHYNVTHMAWDTMGVLLAVVSSDTTLHVYDWDMVMAADVMGRSDRARNCHDSVWTLEPIISFKLPYPVASIQWNQFDVNGNELALGFRSSGEVRIYNLELVEQWLGRVQRPPSSTSLWSIPSPSKTPPPKTYRKLSVARTSGSASVIHYLNAEHILVSLRDRVYCWKLSDAAYGKTYSDVSNVYWRFDTPSSIVTSMTSLGSNMVVIGTNKGQLFAVDWTRTTKERSFSVSAGRRPVLIQTWTPHNRLGTVQQDSRLRMGILNLVVETTSTNRMQVGDKRNNKMDTNAIRSGESHWGRCQIKWVTESGWLMSTTVEAPSLRGPCKVHVTSPRIVYKNTDGDILETGGRPRWTLPQQPIGIYRGTANSTTIAWCSVPGVTHILPHHDKFVLDSQPTTIRSRERSIYLSTSKALIHKIPLPSSIKGSPHALAIHPNKEWIVIAEGRTLQILCGRECKIRGRPLNRTSTDNIQ
jgi:hypothetical protein